MGGLSNIGGGPNLLRAHAYVDGENFLKAVRKHGGPQFVDFLALATLVAQRGPLHSWLGRNCAVARVSYYDAEPDEAHSEKEERLRYHAALESLPDVSVRYGFLRRASRSSKREQTGVDILLAVDMLEDAHRGIVDVAMLFAGDADFAPLVEAVRQYGPRTVVVSYSDLSNDLRLAADVVMEVDNPDLPVAVPELRL